MRRLRLITPKGCGRDPATQDVAPVTAVSCVHMEPLLRVDEFGEGSVPLDGGPATVATGAAGGEGRSVARVDGPWVEDPLYLCRYVRLEAVEVVLAAGRESINRPRDRRFH